MFYAPWCGHCKQMAPDFKKLATELKGASKSGDEMEKLVHEKCKIGAVDATVNKDLATLYGVKSYPTIKLFKNGEFFAEYKGDRNAEYMKQFLTRKMGPAAKSISSVEELKKMMSEKEVLVLGLFKSKDEKDYAPKEFLEVAERVEDLDFVISSDDSIFKEFNLKTNRAVLLLRKADNKQLNIQDFSPELDDNAMFDDDNIHSFVKRHRLPLVNEFTDKTLGFLFSGDFTKHIMIFLKKSDPKSGEIINVLEKIAEKYQKKSSHFIYLDKDNEAVPRVMEFFGIDVEDLPTTRIINLDDMKKFKPSSDEITFPVLDHFVEEFFAGKLKPHLKSQPLPKDWDKKPVKVLTGENFNEVVLNKDKKVLVFFYAPWCKHCKDLHPIYDQLAQKYESNKDIVIASTDATQNEFETVTVQSFPMIYLYLTGSDKKPMEYKDKRTLESLSKFIDTDGKVGKSSEAKQDDDSLGDEDDDEYSDEDEDADDIDDERDSHEEL